MVLNYEFEHKLDLAISALSRMVKSLETYKSRPTANPKYIDVQEQNISATYQFIECFQNHFDLELPTIFHSQKRIIKDADTLLKDKIVWQQCYEIATKQELFWFERYKELLVENASLKLKLNPSQNTEND